MSIHLPEYSHAPPPLLPRSARRTAIFQNQFLERFGAINIVILAFLFIVGILPTVLGFYLSGISGGLFGGTGAQIFDVPYDNGASYFFLVLLASSVGAAIISGDLATRAMTLYLARPIRPIDYLVGKAGALALWLFLGTAVPGLVAVALVLSLGYASLPLAFQGALGYLFLGALGTSALGGVALACSSIASRPTYAGAGIFGSLVGAEAVAVLLNAVARRPSFLYLSPEEDLGAVASAVFGVSGNPLDPGTAASLLALVGAGGFGFAYLRLHRTEVVAE